MLDALRRHLDGSQWALLEEVERIDLLAVGCWRSTGYRWHGYEVKISRGDWLRELRQAGKAQDGLCHAWTVVTLPGVVKPGEVPPAWGHSVLSADGHVRSMKRPAVRATPLAALGSADREWGLYQRLTAQSAIARRASYCEADARALVECWPGTPEQLAAALAVAQKRTGRVLPGVGVYGAPGSARSEAP